MFSIPGLRSRIPSEKVAGANTQNAVPSQPATGANVRIRGGEFGEGSPAGAFQTNPNSGSDGLYAYHEGDLFSPGAGNWVFEPNFELPLITIWGNAFLRMANTFKPLQPPQVFSTPTVVNNGLGGLEAGTVELTALSFEEF